MGLYIHICACGKNQHYSILLTYVTSPLLTECFISIYKLEIYIERGTAPLLLLDLTVLEELRPFSTYFFTTEKYIR